jgi:hypothetical protein
MSPRPTEQTMTVINFFGGAGVGKSTAAAGLFHWLKLSYVNAELVTEFAKDLVWQGSAHLLAEQSYVFGQQVHRLHVLRHQVDFAVTDSPITNSVIYAGDDYPASFSPYAFDLFRTFRNQNFFINRNPDYVFQQLGRVHTEADSDAVAVRMKDALRAENIPFHEIMAGDNLPERIFAALVNAGVLKVPPAGLKMARRILARAAADENGTLTVRGA